MKQVFDLIRQRWVAATPEEMVRQTWICRMITQLKFPRELMTVEKELKVLPHLTRDHPGRVRRRIDLLCYIKTNDTLSPLLLMECKEAELTQEALEQVVSYNHYVKAPYVAVVNCSSIRFRYQLACKACEILYLPSYGELVESIRG